MSRIKKSRKPSFVAPTLSKEDKKKLAVASDKKPKSKSGKQSGNRQKEAFKNTKEVGNTNQSRDPRIGSKKPIELGQPTVAAKETEKFKVTKKAPIAAVREINNNEALEQELYAIEDDTQLQIILAKQEDDIPLTEIEVDFFNEKMTRHEEIRSALGWEDEDENDEVITSNSKNTDDEEALWDKLDKSNPSDYE